MNTKKIVFFALFALLISSSLFAKKAAKGADPKIVLTPDLLQSGVWEVVSIDEDVYPLTQDGVLMHMYLIFSKDGNLYVGCKFVQGNEEALGLGNKSVKYVLKGNVISFADSDMDYSIDKTGRMILTEKGDDGKMILQAVDSPSIQDIKNAETMDLGDLFN